MPEIQSTENPQRYKLIYKEGISSQKALTELRDSKLYLFSESSRTIGAEIPEGLLKKLDESGLFEIIKLDLIKGN